MFTLKAKIINTQTHPLAKEAWPLTRRRPNRPSLGKVRRKLLQRIETPGVYGWNANGEKPHMSIYDIENYSTRLSDNWGWDIVWYWWIWGMWFYFRWLGPWQVARGCGGCEGLRILIIQGYYSKGSTNSIGCGKCTSSMPCWSASTYKFKKPKGKSMSLGLQQWSTNNSKCHKSQGCFCLLLFVHQTSVVELRKFEVIELADAQDGWKIETRRRMSGKMKGQNYKVYISPDGTKYYSLTQACKNGFQASAEHDGRTTRRKKAGNMRKKK